MFLSMNQNVIEKTFVASTEIVNKYGYRVLTKGIETDDFLNNPVMLGDHYELVGKWGMVEKKDGKLYVGNPQFARDEKAKIWKDRVEDGIINAVSIGFLVMETSQEPAMMLAGQKYPTVTKAKLIEVSLATIPANGEAVGLKLYKDELDENGNYKELSLTDFQKQFEIKPTQLSIQDEIDRKMDAEKLKELESKLADMQSKLSLVETATKEAEDAKKALEAIKQEKLSLENTIADNQKKMQEMQEASKGTQTQTGQLSWEEMEKKDPKGLMELLTKDPEKALALATQYNKNFFENGK